MHSCGSDVPDTDLWVAKHTHKLLHSQIMGQLLESLGLVLGQGVVHVKAYSLHASQAIQPGNTA